MSWRTTEGSPRKDRRLCDHYEWGSWTGNLNVCDLEAKHRGRHRQMEATPLQALHIMREREKKNAD